MGRECQHSDANYLSTEPRPGGHWVTNWKCRSCDALFQIRTGETPTLLMRYGQHDMDCPSHPLSDTRDNPSCTCGFANVLSGGTDG